MASSPLQQLSCHHNRQNKPGTPSTATATATLGFLALLLLVPPCLEKEERKERKKKRSSDETL